jgi:hypothetical protein
MAAHKLSGKAQKGNRQEPQLMFAREVESLR